MATCFSVFAAETTPDEIVEIVSPLPKSPVITSGEITLIPEAAAAIVASCAIVFICCFFF